MSAALDTKTIERMFIAACRDELAALKPGNVHIHASGHGMDTAQFENSAAAAAPHIADTSAKVGTRIRRAVDASFKAARCNTNLGIVLLCAPLAAAAQNRERDLRTALGNTLQGLDIDDASEVFAAIAGANPAGLGRVEKGDVTNPANMTLLEAMQIAAPRDRIARAYVNGFEDIFGFGLARLDEARAASKSRPDEATTALHMAFLSTYPDSHILRKYGEAAAFQVQLAARAHAAHARPPISGQSRAALLDFDGELKSKGINPGTTADFVVGTLFTSSIISARRGEDRQ